MKVRPAAICFMVKICLGLRLYTLFLIKIHRNSQMPLRVVTVSIWVKYDVVKCDVVNSWWVIAAVVTATDQMGLPKIACHSFILLLENNKLPLGTMFFKCELLKLINKQFNERLVLSEVSSFHSRESSFQFSFSVSAIKSWQRHRTTVQSSVFDWGRGSGWERMAIASFSQCERKLLNC